MLIFNGQVIHANPMVLFGLGWNNFQRPDAWPNSTVSLNNNAKASQIPIGYYPPKCWMMPRKLGNMTNRGTTSGTGAVSPLSMAQGLNGSAPITGAGTLSAIGALIVSATANLTGSGDITTAQLVAVLQAVANLSGTVSVSALLGALANVAADLTGSGTADGSVINALGEMDASLAAYGALTPDNLAIYVWNYIIEQGFSAQQLMRLISAAQLGEVSGASGTIVTFRDVNNTVNRITATVDSYGDRTAVTLDPN